jgi:undecaprenyl-diphosphatase
MADQTIVGAVLLGILEGLTEFIPVSSTGHVILAGHFLGFQSPGNTFEILIQLGAILAILSVYFARLWNLVIDLPSSPKARRFVAAIVLAFLPAAFVGVFAHGFIKTILFEAPTLICVVLIIGGVILMVIDRMPLKPRYTDVMDFPISLAIKIGCCQGPQLQAHCSWAPINVPQQNFRSFLRCQPWQVLLFMIFIKISIC